LFLLQSEEVLTAKKSAFYGVSLNNPIILSTIGFSGGSTVYKILMNTAIGNLIIVLAGAIPGYWVRLIIPLLYHQILLSLIDKGFLYPFPVLSAVTNAI